MGIDWSNFNPNFGQQLGALFDPNVIAEKQNRLSQLANGNALQQMQVMQGVNEMNRAPIEQQRRDAEYAQKVAEHQAALGEAQRVRVLKARLLDPSTPQEEKVQIYTHLFPEEAAKQAFKPPAEHVVGGNLLRGDKVVFSAPEKPTSIIQEMRAAGISETSPQGQKMLRDRLTKETTHAPAANMKTVINPAIDPFKNEKALREEYQGLPQVKSASEMNTAFKMIETAYKTPSAANDLAMATKFMKILDPTSVVRESEFAMAVNATGLMDKVYNYANAIKTGQRLNPVQRKDFYDSAKAMNEAFQSEAANSSEKYKGIASQYGLNPSNITIGTEFVKPLTGANPHSGKTDAQIKAELGL